MIVAILPEFSDSFEDDYKYVIKLELCLLQVTSLTIPTLVQTLSISYLPSPDIILYTIYQDLISAKSPTVKDSQKVAYLQSQKTVAHVHLIFQCQEPSVSFWFSTLVN